MPGISFAELVEKIQSGSITSKELQKYFIPDPLNSKPFQPQLTINRDVVNVAGVERIALASSPQLAIDANNAIVSAAARRGPKPNGTIVAEGDSWFCLPLHPIFPDTMIDFLAENYPVNNLAHWGDELEEMLVAKQYYPFLKDKTVKYLLFSAGGNDILGGDQLERCLNIYDHDHSDPKDAAYYLRPDFYSNLNQIERDFLELLDQVVKNSPDTIVAVHGYDYAIPRVQGNYLGIHFERQGISPEDHSDLCRAIVKLMVDHFNRRLDYIAEHHPNFVHVDFRGTIEDDEWFDELHPREPAAKRMAKKLAKIVDGK